MKRLVKLRIAHPKLPQPHRSALQHDRLDGFVVIVAVHKTDSRPQRVGKDNTFDRDTDANRADSC